MLVADLLEALGAPHSRPLDRLPDGYHGGFWIHPGSDRVVTTDAGLRRDEHVDSVLAHPDWFGLDPAEIADAEPAAVMRAAMANGWVRCTYWTDLQELNLDAITLQDARAALRRLLKTRLVQALYMHLLGGQGDVFVEDGDAVDRFARTGAVPRAA